MTMGEPAKDAYAAMDKMIATVAPLAPPKCYPGEMWSGSQLRMRSYEWFPWQRYDHMIQQVSSAVANPAFATPFCHGLWKLVRFRVMPKLFTRLTTSSLKFAARSKIRYPGTESYGKHSRTC